MLSPGLRTALQMIEQQQHRTSCPRAWKALNEHRSRLMSALVELEGREGALREGSGRRVPIHHGSCTCEACRRMRVAERGMW